MKEKKEKGETGKSKYERMRHNAHSRNTPSEKVEYLNLNLNSHSTYFNIFTLLMCFFLMICKLNN